MGLMTATDIMGIIGIMDTIATMMVIVEMAVIATITGAAINLSGYVMAWLS